MFMHVYIYIHIYTYIYIHTHTHQDMYRVVSVSASGRVLARGFLVFHDNCFRRDLV